MKVQQDKCLSTYLESVGYKMEIKYIIKKSKFVREPLLFHLYKVLQDDAHKRNEYVSLQRKYCKKKNRNINI